MALLKHTGLVCAKEENADRFYGELLGLAKMGARTLPKELSKAIFNIDADLKMINYITDELHFEVFIQDQEKRGSGIVEHICLEVDDREAFLNRCQALGLKITQIEQTDKRLVFIFDFDGHLFEIKSRVRNVIELNSSSTGRPPF